MSGSTTPSATVTAAGYVTRLGARSRRVQARVRERKLSAAAREQARRARGRLGGAPRDRRRARARGVVRPSGGLVLLTRAPSLSRGGARGGAQPARRTRRAGRRTRPLVEGAPVPVFKPSQREVREMLDALARHTRIEAHADGCTGFTHCHHEKVIVIDGRVAFVGGIDLTLDGGDPWDTPSHVARGGIGWHDAAVRIEGPAVADVEQHFRLRWHGTTRELLPSPTCPTRPATSRLRSSGRSRRAQYRAVRGGDYSILEAYIGCASLGRAVHLPREPVPLVARDRRDPRGQAGESAVRRLPRPRPPARAGERRRRHLARPGRRAHPRGGRDDPVPRLHDLRARAKPPRSRVRALEDRHRRRPLAHPRLGEPERALALPRHRDERRDARPGRMARAARLRLWSEHLELRPRRSRTSIRSS